MLEARSRENRKGLRIWYVTEELPDANLIKENYLHYLNLEPEKAWKEYIYGYFAHIYTDLRWIQTLYADFKKENIDDKEHIGYTYNQEVSQLEFELKRSQPWTDSILNKLKDSEGHAIPLFVEKSEVEQYRTIKLEWLLDERNEPKIELIYFTLDKVEMFIQDIAGELNTLFIPSEIHAHGG